MDWCSVVSQLWPESERENAYNICIRESGGEPTARAVSDVEDSRGLFQINVLAHPELASYDLYNPWINASLAFRLWREQGWAPWSTASDSPRTPATPAPSTSGAGQGDVLTQIFNWFVSNLRGWLYGGVFLILGLLLIAIAVLAILWRYRSDISASTLPIVPKSTGSSD